MSNVEIQQRMRSHLMAFASVLAMALIAGGLAIAGVSNGYLILGIAAAQAAIILTAMMHARADGPWVRGTLIFAAFFLAVLLGAVVLAQRDTIAGTEYLHPVQADVPAQGEAH